LRYSETVSRATEAAGVGNGEEITEVADFDRIVHRLAQIGSAEPVIAMFPLMVED
jgi:hypothetical protein